MAELSPEYPVELLHDDLSRVLSTLFLIGRKLSTFLEPATKRALEQLTDKVVLFLRPKPDTIRYTAEDDDGKLKLSKGSFNSPTETVKFFDCSNGKSH